MLLNCTLVCIACISYHIYNSFGLDSLGGMRYLRGMREICRKLARSGTHEMPQAGTECCPILDKYDMFIIIAITEMRDSNFIMPYGRLQINLSIKHENKFIIRRSCGRIDESTSLNLFVPKMSAWIAYFSAHCLSDCRLRFHSKCRFSPNIYIILNEMAFKVDLRRYARTHADTP